VNALIYVYLDHVTGRVILRFCCSPFLKMSLFSSRPIRSCLSSHPEHLRCLRRTFCGSSSRLQVTNDVNGKAQNTKNLPLPPLNRPLGVRQRPTTIQKTTRQRLKDLMNQDARMAQRRHLYVTPCRLMTIFQIDYRKESKKQGRDISMT
jgi:hypothetical protein